jgi:MoaA/NifB/PqqE/SkfB family radical SAM enzyme
MAYLGYVQLTRQCMQSCVFCSNPPTGVELDLDGLRETLDRLAAAGCDGIILTGGEPTASPLLLPAIEEAAQRGLSVRLITNGQLFADRQLLQECVSRGLGHVHLSLYSYRAEVHDAITRRPGSWRRATVCLAHIGELGITCDINTVISTFNCDHLHETVAWLCQQYPFVRHVVWNNIDPSGERARGCLQVVPRLHQFEVSLELAMDLLERTGRSFRAERVPLCAMRRYGWASTETRKIVKGEARTIRFLDERGLWHQHRFAYDKASACAVCRFEPICAGIFMMGLVLQAEDISPVFEDPLEVVRRVLNREPGVRELVRIGLASDPAAPVRVDRGERSANG